MAALHRLLSQARRYTPNSSSSKLIYVRSLCSSSSLPNPNPNPPSPPNEPNRNRPPQSASVQPVSYPIKDPSPQPDPIPQNSQLNNNNVEPRVRTREDVRFVKDFNPSLSSSLSSSLPDPDPNPNPNPNPPSPPYEPNRNRPPQSASVQPVSYPIKDPSPQPDPIAQNSQPNNNNVEPRGWTREDARFVKDFNPSLSSSLSSSRDVNFATRVAPLPKDKTENEIQKANDELEAERMKIEAENRVRRSIFRTVVEEQKVPFPTLIKVDPLQKQNKAQKVVHDLKEAVRLVKENAKRNFDETLEAHVKLAVDLRRTDLKLTGSLSLPHGSGKALRVAVFADGAAADEARAAGADMVGGEDLIEGIKNGTINVKEIDKCIAVPQLMPRIGKEISKKLNRLTPNARDGSVTTDISTAVKEAKKNIKFKKDKSAIVHVGLGKVSFTEEALCENVGAFVNALLLAKPAGLKKSSKYAGYVTTFHICSTMGPSYPVSIQSLSIAADRYTKLQMR